MLHFFMKMTRTTNFIKERKTMKDDKIIIFEDDGTIPNDELLGDGDD